MVEFIALGVQERGDKKNSDSDHSTSAKKGLYLFDSSGKDIKRCTTIQKVADNIFTKSSPDLEELLSENGSKMDTPRIVKNVGGILYMISRVHVTQLSYIHSQDFPFSMQKCDLNSFISIDKNDSELVRLLRNNDNLNGFIGDAHNGVVYLSLFIGDQLRREKSFHELEKGVPLGLLPRHQIGTSNADVVTTNYNPTGRLLVEGNTLRMVSKRNLLTYDLDKMAQRGVLNGNSDEANILDFSSVDGYTLFSTNKEGYVLSVAGNTTVCEKSEHYSCINDRVLRTCLPAPATSVLIYKQNSNNGSTPSYYALFGLERGMVRVYQIQHQYNRLPFLEFKKTIPLISSENNDAAKERYVLNLRQVNDYVCFTMGNLFIKMPFRNFIGFDDKKRIVRSQEGLPVDDYLKCFKECYSPDKLLRVPHQITSYDFWSVNP